ncbi:hypothetical protein [Actinoallomurus sp. NPDC052274]|uniref:hypothetical protein n=1 Tax=Actinoallomurus sp. NPDC052274 TaxID=3155420 RepID=UPI00343BF949
MLRTSPVMLPWTTLRLAGRFAVPLALWFTVGEVLRYLLFLAGYHFGLHNSVIPIIVLSLTVMVSLGVTAAMVHSVREGLPAVQAREVDERLTSWAAAEEEGILDAITRALLPFMIFYLAWGWFADDAKEFVQSAAGRGTAQGGIFGATAGMKILIALQDHLWVAIICTVVFFAVKFVAERVVEPRWPGVGGVCIAFCEVNWTLFGIFTVDQVRGDVTGWITGRVAWVDLGRSLGPVFGTFNTMWPLFKDAVLGSLVWLVIAGVILGVTAEEEAALGQGWLGRKVVFASGIDRPHTPREVLTRELRDKWLPAVYGLRMVFRAGMLPFGVFCALFTGLEALVPVTERGVYYLLGPHELGWWQPRLTMVEFPVELVHQVLRVCLLAAAFDLVVGRVSARTAESGSARSSSPRPARSLVPPAGPYSPPSPGRPS